MIPLSLSARFKTNYVPSEDELSSISYALQYPTQRLSALDIELAKRKAEYESILVQHKSLVQDIADLQALASPMRRLPPDVIIEIFLHCLPTANNAIMSPTAAPILLTHVCSSWRTLALNTPALWASIHIPVPSFSDSRKSMTRHQLNSKEVSETFAQEERIAKDWLARSGACPLSISFHDGNRQISATDKRCISLLNTFLPMASRWQSMKLTSSPQLLRHVASLTADDVPKLEDLELEMTPKAPWGYGPGPGAPTDSNTTKSSPWKSGTFLSAPRLHRVSFVNVPEDIDQLPLRWSHLTKLCIQGLTGSRFGMLTVPDAAALLVRCPQLQEARLEIRSPPPTGPGPAGATIIQPPPAIPHILPGAANAAMTQLNQMAANLPIWPHHPHHPAPEPDNEIDKCPLAMVLPNLTSLSLRNCGADLTSFIEQLVTPSLRRFEYYGPPPAGGPRDYISTSALPPFVARVADTLRSFVTNLAALRDPGLIHVLRLMPGLLKLRLVHARYQYTSSGVFVNDTFLGRMVGRPLGLSGITGMARDDKGKARRVETPTSPSDSDDDVYTPMWPEEDFEDSTVGFFSTLDLDMMFDPYMPGDLHVNLAELANRRRNRNKQHSEVNKEDEFSNGTFLLPNLEEFECMLSAEFTDEGILEFIHLRQARVLPVSPLRVFSVNFRRPQTRPMRKVLSPIVEAGLKVTLGYTRKPPRYTFSPEEGIYSSGTGFWDSQMHLVGEALDGPTKAALF